MVSQGLQTCSHFYAQLLYEVKSLLLHEKSLKESLKSVPTCNKGYLNCCVHLFLNIHKSFNLMAICQGFFIKNNINCVLPNLNTDQESDKCLTTKKKKKIEHKLQLIP